MTDLETHEPVPDVSVEEWDLGVTGAVERPASLSMDDLRSLPLEAATDDFECLEGWVAEDLTWRGVCVAEVLALAEPTAEAGYGLVRAIDGDYACAFRLDRLSGAILAVELDGEPLAPEHGGPARLAFPGTDSECWESVKWVRGIEIRESEPTAADTAEATALARIE